jgi:nucleoside-diphosphate-sugar epimerase
VRVLHLEIPRGLSFTLKEWRGDWAGVFAEGDDSSWRQVDLNFDFWPWILDDDRTGLFGRIIDFHHHAPFSCLDVLRACERQLNQGAIRPEFESHLWGLRFSPRVTASPAELKCYTQTAPAREYFDGYFRHLCRRFMLLSGYSLVSLGVDSLEGLVFASLLADFVHRHDPCVRVCLTRHQHENYSLVQRLPELVQEGSLLQIFDAIVHYEERAAEALRGLVPFFEDGNPAGLSNVAVLLPDGPRLFPPGDDIPASFSDQRVDPVYVQDTRVPPDRLIYFTPLARQACHHRRCTFCVQNRRYLPSQGLPREGELSQTLSTLESLVRQHGVSSFSFSDQTLPPDLLRGFAGQVQERGLGLSWCGRMIFDPQAIDDELLSTLRRSGCREILFGMESVRRETLAAMGKRARFEPSDARGLLDRMEAHGIDVVLNVIYAFPVESEVEFEATTWPFVEEMARRHANLTVVTNRFALFRGSTVERSPSDYGVAAMSTPDSPLRIERDFVDVHGRDSAAPHPREDLYLRTSAGTREGPGALSPEEARLVCCIHHGSIGLHYRWRTGTFFPKSISVPSDKPTPMFATVGGGERDVLVLGCNGYVGENLALAVDARRLILSSCHHRSARLQGIDAPFIREDLKDPTGVLAAAAPREVYLLARSTSDDIRIQAAFAANIKSMLYSWIQRKRLERVVFLSTQLVYPTPPDSTPVSSSTPVAPLGLYEYFKVELEGFLRYLADTYGLQCEVFRLPLVWGGLIEPSQRREQLIYRWVDDLVAGARWRISTGEEREYGNSWVWMPDLIKSLLRPGQGLFSIRQPVSGHFTYWEIQQAVTRGANAGSGERLHLPRTRFFLCDEENLRPRSLSEMITEGLEADKASMKRP